MDYIKHIVQYMSTEIDTVVALDRESIKQVIETLDDALQNERRIYVMGNGGSGSTASHMTNDFNKAIFTHTSHTFNFTCLNDNIPYMLAIANDEGYEEIFRYQLLGKLKPEDIVIAFSGSGNSLNIINAVEYAKKVGTKVIGFTGYDGGMLKELADISVDTNINDMEITEDIHLMIEHLMIRTFKSKYSKNDYQAKVRKLLDE